MRRFVNGPATPNIATATWSTAGPQKFEFFFLRFLNRKIDLSIKKTITRSKLIFAKFHKMSMFRYLKIDFGCLKCPRMIPGTK